MSDTNYRPPVFDEPEGTTSRSHTVLSDWLLTAHTSEARTARGIINGWYSSFPDTNDMVRSRLRARSDDGVSQAIDEIHVHNLIAKDLDVRYEEDADSPDFRLYRSSIYLAGIEVATLFAERDFSTQSSRNAQLTAEINARVVSVGWYLSYEVRRWDRQFSFRQLAGWINEEISKLPAPSADMSAERYPVRSYRATDVEIEFRFIPRATGDSSGPIETAVAFGPMVMLWSKASTRLRQVVTKKAGGRYSHRNAPFAVVMVVRDPLCDEEDIVDALYGSQAISFTLDELGTAHSTRRSDGIFGRDRGTPDGKNRRLSCVFILKPGWWPPSNMATGVLRFDNPFADREFPPDLLAHDRRFAAIAEPGGLRMEWL